MFNIANQYDHVTFIRYNPDTFRINGKIRKPILKNRIKLLLEVIKKEQTIVSDDNLRVVKVCYDNVAYTGIDTLSEYGIQIVNMEEFIAKLPMMGMPYNP